MEPLEPRLKEELARKQLRKSATRGEESADEYTQCLTELAEYERLLAERFLLDPDLPKVPEVARQEDNREARLAELYQKYFVD